MATVKTYKALKQQNVAGQVRHFGDFIPEAAEWPNLAVWLRSGHIEETFIDSEELERAIEIQRAADMPLTMFTEEGDGVQEELASEDGSLPATDDDAEDDDEGPKKVLKVKKGKSNG